MLYLQEHENIDAVIIGADVAEQEEKVKQLRGIVLALKPNAPAADVQWELSCLFPERANPIQ